MPMTPDAGEQDTALDSYDAAAARRYFPHCLHFLGGSRSRRSHEGGVLGGQHGDGRPADEVEVEE